MINVPETCTIVLIIGAMFYCNSSKTLEVYLKEKEVTYGKKQEQSFLRYQGQLSTKIQINLKICFGCDQVLAQCFLTLSHPAMRLYTFSTRHLRRRTFWWIISFWHENGLLCKHFWYKLICIPCTDSDKPLSNFIRLENSSSN